MDISSFETSYNYNRYNNKIGKYYCKTIGNCELTIYIGFWCGSNQSFPWCHGNGKKNVDDDINTFTSINIEIEFDQINVIEQKFGLVEDTYNCGYFVSPTVLEEIYKFICNYNASSSEEQTLTTAVTTTNKRQEKPCRGCGKPNDLGVGSCWWCEISNPV